MTTFIEKHFKGLVVLLLIIICLLSYTRRNNGRYMLCPCATKGIVYVLDTKTSKLWLRLPSANVYMGTNNKPEIKPIKEKKTENANLTKTEDPWWGQDEKVKPFDEIGKTESFEKWQAENRLLEESKKDSNQ